MLMAADLFNDWTIDAKGNYIDWTKPPYYVRGVLNIRLPGEPPLSLEDTSKRNSEYMKLTRRALKGRNKNGQRAGSSPAVKESQRAAS